jgi:hypothetical protein
MSVSTLRIGSGAATPVRWSNFCMDFLKLLLALGPASLHPASRQRKPDAERRPGP